MKLSTSYAATWVAVIIAYQAGMGYAELYATLPGEMTLVWPPAGIGFAAALMVGPRIWPAIAAATVLGHLWIAPVPLAFLPFSAAANAASVVVAVLALRRFVDGPLWRLSVRRGFALLCGGLLLSVVGASIGSVGMAVAGMAKGGLAATFLAWMLGDLFGVVICGPAVLSLILRFSGRDRNIRGLWRGGVAEKIAWLVGFAGVGLALAWLARQDPDLALPLNLLPFSFLIWSALRFPPWYTHTALMAVMLIIVAMIDLGRAGFDQPESVAEFATFLVLLAVMSAMPLLVSASTFERRRYARKLTWRADHDRLTGLLNRDAFEERVKAALIEVNRTNEPIALCYMDLDQFKVVNDTCGHGVGDHFIKQIAAALRRNLRPNDLLARLGGDEFGLLLRNCPVERVQHRVDTLRDRVGAHRFVWQKRVFSFTLSAGITPVDVDVRADFARLLSEADAACYAAKEQGRNRSRLSNHSDRELVRRHRSMEWAARINDALERDRFRLYCQPISPIGKLGGSTAHFEILVRMVDENGDLLLPGAFLPAAERYNLMTRIDRWVVSRALRWLVSHPAILERVEICAVNLSGSSLGDDSFHRFLKKIFGDTGAPCEKLCFEITETAAISDLDSASRLIDAMKRLGCRFALDDFGAGLSSLAYLKTLQVDYLKIDGSFVRDLLAAPVDWAMVKSINDMGHVMGKKTIAEFVDSEEIAEALRDLGVDFAQGYAVGQPVPINEFFGLPAARQRSDA